MFSTLLWRKPQTSPSVSQDRPSTADGASPSPVPHQLRTPSPSELALDSTNAIATKGTPEYSPECDTAASIPNAEANPTLASIDPQAEPEAAVKALLELLPAIPAKTLHTYTTTHLNHISTTLSNPSPPDSPVSAHQIPSDQIPAIFSFFSALTPPPQLHCVRCHKDYVEVENSTRSCLVAHDDDSAEVERVGRNRVAGETGAEYVTIWNCCGKTVRPLLIHHSKAPILTKHIRTLENQVEGDGDQGPPDGWCYEGKHTVHISISFLSPR